MNTSISKKFTRLPLSFFLLFFCISQTTEASAEEPLVGTVKTLNPRALGLSGAMVAGPAGTSGVYINPATISMAPLYHFEGMYQFTARENMHMGGLAVVDSVTTVVGAGVSFNYSGIEQARTSHQAYDVRLSLSGAVGKMLFLGATGRYLRLEQNIESSKWGPAGKAALPKSGNQQVDGFTFDAGAALKIGDLISLGVTGYNLTNTESVFAPIELASGASVSLIEMLLIELDVVTDFTSHDEAGAEIRFGGELFVAGAAAIRGGYMYDIYYNMHGISAGIGYVHSRFALDAGFSQELRDNGRIAVSIGLKFFVN
jgi:hypothetical protein